MQVIAVFLLGAAAAATCFDYQPRDPPLYCDNQVTWSVSDDLDPWTQSHKAYQLYYALKERYLKGDDSAPTLDCLAIAQKFFCAYSFPYCDSPEDSSRGVCSFLCDLYSTRCPNEEYDLYCKSSSDTKCSGAVHWAVSLLVVVTALL